MPKLIQYSRQVSPQQTIQARQATAADFNPTQGARAPNELAGLGSGITDLGVFLQEMKEESELSDVRRRAAESRAKWTEELMTRADRGMPLGGEGFTDQLTQDFDRESSSGADKYETNVARKAYTEKYATLRSELTIRAVTQQAKAAAKKRISDVTEAVKADGVSVYRDPTQFSSVLENRLKEIAEMPNIGEPEREELTLAARDEIVIRAIQGEINFNPEFALRKLKNGEWDDKIDNAELLNKMLNSAESAVEDDIRDQERIERLARRAEKKEQEAVLNNFVVRMDRESDNPVSFREINSSMLPPKEKVWLKNLIAKNNEITTDSTIFVETLFRVYSGKISDEADIYSLVGDGLGFSDAKSIVSVLKDKQDPQRKAESDAIGNVLRQARSALTRTDPLTGIRDPNGDRQYAGFFIAMQKRKKELEAQGVSIFEMADPKNDNYLGHLIKPFERSLAEIMKDLAGGGPGGASAPQPGQTIPFNPGFTFEAGTTILLKGEIYKSDGAKWVRVPR